MTLKFHFLGLIAIACATVFAFGQSVVKPATSASRSVYDRGSAALSKGDFESAISDYSDAIAMDPKNAGAFAGRGAAKRLKGDFEGSLNDLNRSIELNPNVQSSFYTRAWVNLFLDHGDAAYSDAVKLLSFNESNQMIFPSHVLIAYFGLRQAKRDAEAEAFLKTGGSKLYTGAWTVQIIKYLKREVNEDLLFSSASGNRALIEAHAYVGMDQSVSGRKDAALINFRWVISNADKRMFEYSLAKNQIAKLTAAAAN